MSMRAVAMVATLLLAGSAYGAAAADIARLEWGGFVVEDDSSNGWDGYKSVAADDGHSISLSFASLDAKADGATSEDRSWFKGRYDVYQPAEERFDSLSATIEGHVIKSGAAVARLVVTIGSEENIVEWPLGATVSEKYRREFVLPVSSDGRLPTPLTVRVETFARKDGTSDAAYVSVDTVLISTASTRLAGN